MIRAMVFSDRTLAQRLEASEGYACAQFAVARKRLFPDCGSAWMRRAGADVVFDGMDAPTTQTFGLGISEPLTAETLNEIEEFFVQRGAVPMHEISPFAGAETLSLLCARGYAPFEISSVLFQELSVVPASASASDRTQIRMIEPAESALWAAVNARGWAHEHPEFEEFLKSTGELLAARENSPCFLAQLDGTPAAAAGLCLHEGVALLAGAATVPEYRHNGLQAALLAERMRFAHNHGCDLAMIVTEAGSLSQRNAERAGFRIAYTRLKWKPVSPRT